jgi:hypothetical protein
MGDGAVELYERIAPCRCADAGRDYYAGAVNARANHKAIYACFVMPAGINTAENIPAAVC